MDFFSPALQMTISSCSLPLVIISLAAALRFALVRFKRIRDIPLAVFAQYFLVTFVVAITVTLAGTWLFLLVGTEKPPY